MQGFYFFFILYICVCIVLLLLKPFRLFFCGACFFFFVCTPNPTTHIFTYFSTHFLFPFIFLYVVCGCSENTSRRGLNSCIYSYIGWFREFLPHSVLYMYRYIYNIFASSQWVHVVGWVAGKCVCWVFYICKMLGMRVCVCVVTYVVRCVYPRSYIFLCDSAILCIYASKNIYMETSTYESYFFLFFYLIFSYLFFLFVRCDVVC